MLRAYPTIFLTGSLVAVGLDIRLGINPSIIRHGERAIDRVVDVAGGVDRRGDLMPGDFGNGWGVPADT